MLLNKNQRDLLSNKSKEEGTSKLLSLMSISLRSGLQIQIQQKEMQRRRRQVRATTAAIHLRTNFSSLEIVQKMAVSIARPCWSNCQCAVFTLRARI